MEKNEKKLNFQQYAERLNYLKKILVVALFVCICFPVLAQEISSRKVTLDLKAVTVKELIKEVEKQTKLGFIYNLNEAQVVSKVTVKADDENIESVLDRALGSIGLGYEIDKDVIIIKPKKTTQKIIKKENKLIEGVVVDENGITLPGVAIIDTRTLEGVVTDVDGSFGILLSMSAKEKVTLQFLYLGKKEEDVIVGIETRKPLHIVLEDDETTLDEVVVIGMGDRSKSSFSGAVTVVKREELQQIGTKSLLANISSLVPGMLSIENNMTGADPNKLPEFIIRGRSSFDGASRIPTFIVDGAEVDMEYVYNMPVTEVESVTVLKDASATALYGSKAANGVIVITTNPIKSGDLNIQYSGVLRMAFPDLTDYDLLNAKEKLEYERLAGVYTSGAGGGAQHQMDEVYSERLTRVREGVNTDWIAKPVRNVLSQNHSISAYGGHENVRYSIGGNYRDNKGVMKGSERKYYGLSFRLSYNATEKLFILNHLNVSQVNNVNSPYGSFSNFVKLNPYDRAYNLDGTLNNDLSHSQANPLYEARLGSYNKGEGMHINNTLSAKYTIFKGLRLEGQFTLSKYKNDRERYISPDSHQFKDKERREAGSIKIDNEKKLDYQGKLFASYNKEFGENTLLSIMGGGNFQESNINRNGYTAIGILSDKLAHVAFAQQYSYDTPTGAEYTKRGIGFFSSANIIYKNRYFADFSYRYEGSSSFGANARFAPFWSVGGGWNIHEEDFFKDKSLLQLLKLRGSLGYVGNSSFDATQAITTYRFSPSLFYGNNAGAILNSLGNPELKWERSLKYNIGLDLMAFKGHLDLAFNYYNSTTDNLLLSVANAPSLGFASSIKNIGQLSNTGWELSARVIPIKTKEILWSLNLTAAHNSNKIKKISNALKFENERKNKDDSRQPQPLYEEGESISAIKAVVSAGIDPTTGKEVYVKRDGTLTFDYDYNDKVVVGDTDPKVYGSFGSNFTYKGLSLNLQMGYMLGASLYNTTLVTRVEGANPHYNADKRVFTSRWKNPGDIVRFKNIAELSIPKQTTRFVEKEYRLDVSSVSIGYEFPKNICEKMRLRRLKIDFRTNNLGVISSIKQERGLNYPFERSFEISINTTF